MVVLQIGANVTSPEYVALMTSSWPAGNNIGKHAFKSNNIFVVATRRDFIDCCDLYHRQQDLQ